MDDPLRIGRHAEVPLSEIELRTSRSSGPGGQHANVTATRVEAVFDGRLETALTVQRPRRATKPTNASRRRRADSKRRRAEVKKLRRPPEL